MADPHDDRLAWIDVETTGLNPHEGHLLLEVAAVITDKDLNILDDEGYHAVLGWDPSYAYNLANDYVQSMHDKTGLWDKVATGTSEAHVDDELSSYIAQFAPQQGQARIAGNSVRLDMSFLQEFTPFTYDLLHYRVLDVSSIAFEAYNVRGVAPFEKVLKHEAMSDIRESIEELRYLRANR